MERDSACLTRRDLLRGGAAGLVALALGGAGTAARAVPTLARAGCCLPRGGLSLSAADRRTAFAAGAAGGAGGGTGDLALDRALGLALVRLSAELGERPSFAFVPGDGAAASPDRVVAGTWGSVTFGRAFFREILGDDAHGMGVVAVAAHEFAHIRQMRLGIDRELLRGERTVKRVELHADFLAGYYLGLRKEAMPSLPLQVAGELLRSMGDYAFHDWRHHGTPDERVAAAEAGFAVARADGASLSEASEAGARWVLAHA